MHPRDPNQTMSKFGGKLSSSGPLHAVMNCMLEACTEACDTCMQPID